MISIRETLALCDKPMMEYGEQMQLQKAFRALAAVVGELDPCHDCESFHDWERTSTGGRAPCDYCTAEKYRREQTAIMYRHGVTE